MITLSDHIRCPMRENYFDIFSSPVGSLCHNPFVVRHPYLVQMIMMFLDCAKNYLTYCKYCLQTVLWVYVCVIKMCSNGGTTYI